jgi:chlorobactene glucosyltransferase
MPHVAIIVPARDEADNLRRLLPSLVALRPAAAEIIVVDDRSRDETAAVAGAFPVKLLAGSEPPEGWTGKTWACQQGRAATRTDWLLFTDADTVHEPDSLGAVMAAAGALGADAISLFPEQHCGSFWERLLIPFAFGQLFAAVDGRWANDDRASGALAVGQYLLVRACAYDRVGGHAAVRGSLTEDVSFARLLRARGARLRVLRADGRVQVRMYRGLGEVWGGFRKNSFGSLGADPARGLVVVAATVLASLAPLLGWRAARGGGSALAVGLGYLVGVSSYLPWLGWFGVPPKYAPLQPIAASVFLVIAAEAAVRALFRLPVGWKGRSYRA